MKPGIHVYRPAAGENGKERHVIAREVPEQKPGRRIRKEA